MYSEPFLMGRPDSKKYIKDFLLLVVVAIVVLVDAVFVHVQVQ